MATMTLVCLLPLVGCSGSQEQPPPPSPAPDLGTPLGELDTRRLPVARAEFCEAISPEAVTRALGGEPSRASSYVPGDLVRLSPEVKDVVHEFGCVFAGDRRAEARAWVFAPPVTPAQARTMAASAAERNGCAAPSGADPFGRPSTATVCADRSAAVATYAGLFGDAWLSCSVRANDLGRAELLDRAGRWCVEVATAAQPE